MRFLSFILINFISCTIFAAEPTRLPAMVIKTCENQNTFFDEVKNVLDSKDEPNFEGWKLTVKFPDKSEKTYEVKKSDENQLEKDKTILKQAVQLSRALENLSLHEMKISALTNYEQRGIASTKSNEFRRDDAKKDTPADGFEIELTSPSKNSFKSTLSKSIIVQLDAKCLLLGKCEGTESTSKVIDVKEKETAAQKKALSEFLELLKSELKPPAPAEKKSEPASEKKEEQK